MNKITHFLTGTVGVTAIEAANQIDVSNIEQIQHGTSLLMQIIIGIATLWQMFRKKKTD